MPMLHSQANGLPRRDVLRSVAGLGVLTAVAGCTQGDGDGGSQDGDGTTVSMVNTAFSPLKLEVSTGTTVTWTNEDSVTHTVIAAQFHSQAEDWSFESASIQAGQSTTYTFDSAGIYEYYCDVHGESSMCGAILVGGASLAESLPCENGGGGMY